MFGGHGLYLEESIFAIIVAGRLYLKADDVNRPDFQAAGMAPFTYEAQGRIAAMSYWRCPPSVLADAAALRLWAGRALAAARRARKKTGSKAAGERRR